MRWSTRPRAGARALTGLVAAALLATLSATAGAPVAAAATQEGVGHEVKPGQDGTGSRNWLGSYVVGGQQVFCVSFQLKAPDTDEVYKPGDELLTKWGTKLPADQAANISYLLLRYGDTKKPDEAAALAHLLHSWTSAPRTPADLDASLPAAKIAYDAPFHLAGLPAGARAAVDRLKTEAETNRGPWTASVTKPDGDQHLGEPAAWTVTVKNAKGKGVSDVPVKLTATAATLGEDAAVTAGNASPQAAAKDVTLKTGADGTVQVKLTPTGDQPKLVASLSAPADRPYVRAPVDTAKQRVVSTGGEKELTAQGVVNVAKPGKVQVTKTDANTGKGVGGAVLRITGKDKTTAALGQDGKPLTGADGKPAVVTTDGATGGVTVENLRAPQEICIVEASPPPGYTNAYDPQNPPSACGTVKPDETLALTVTNKPNEVPRAIPAGDQPVAQAHGVVETSYSAPGLAGLGLLVLLGAGLAGFAARRASRR
ncbi:collagen binding domain-containing protein [Amycolatopsis sp. NPDC051758]|uniref:collagen binding domain-containing protein n=1 Tax=Amycolatopsis sp. NPDC051758 TaxID=3363935 RepID=UPI0037907A70